jgi:hypothetical protein
VALVEGKVEREAAICADYNLVEFVYDLHDAPAVVHLLAG